MSFGTTTSAYISIHAPRAGRDAVSNQFFADIYVFQSTRPVRGATNVNQIVQQSGTISIHAPRAGRDLLVISFLLISTYFNPRAPCGARP